MSGKKSASVALVLVLAFLATANYGGEASPALSVLPQGDGIAAKYPGDQGIERDPAVIFADGFEDCSSPADLRSKWDSVVHQSNMRIAEEAANINGGKRALELTVPKRRRPLAIGVSKRLRDERDVLFLRWYSKFEKDFVVQSGSVHNGGSISAHYFSDRGATPGIRADGRNKFLANFEAENSSGKSPGTLNIYCYQPEQSGRYGDHFFPSGTVIPFSYNRSGAATFGSHFVSRPDVVPELDRWYCYEYMVKANTPGERDGRIACWLDGKLVADFPNLRLRDVDSLKIDRCGVGLFIARNIVRTNKKWYDDVVVATSYIGPRVPPR